MMEGGVGHKSSVLLGRGDRMEWVMLIWRGVFWVRSGGEGWGRSCWSSVLPVCLSISAG